ncbi:MAG: type II secretion system F family protein [Actinobacteria bacterium]|nr:MAG: type II secretion system F family protein [Actinomycetota bacterium]
MVLVAALAFASASLMVFASTMAVANRVGVRRSLRRLDDYGGAPSLGDRELSRPFADRVVVPLLHVVSKLTGKLTPAGVVAYLQRQLTLAGTPRELDVDRILALKLLGGVGGALLSLVASVALRPSFTHTLGLVVVLVAAGFFAPDIWLSRHIAWRRKALALALPDTLDLLTISVEAGLSFDAAMSKVVTNTRGPLAEEFYRMLQEVRLGTSRREAFRNLGERTDLPELSAFILAMLQADIFGISIGQILRVQAHEMRIKRRQRAEEIAMKAPVKVVFPLILCIFPALLVVILGPAAIRIYQTLLGG